LRRVPGSKFHMYRIAELKTPESAFIRGAHRMAPKGWVN
jgi:hypothetical protein